MLTKKLKLSFQLCIFNPTVLVFFVKFSPLVEILSTNNKTQILAETGFEPLLQPVKTVLLNSGNLVHCTGPLGWTLD